MTMKADASTPRLSRVILDDGLPSDLPVVIEADRAQAIRELEEGNMFAPRGAGAGPFVLTLSVRDGRLLFDIRDEAMQPVTLIGLALGPLRRLIKDYVMMLDSYATAVQEGREARIQAIDMGRRGLHNEGAALVTARLESKVDIDFDTARRLFTLIAVLHHRIIGPSA